VFEGRWDDGLDEAQLAAVTYTGGPLVVLAGAGTGKTRTLTSRVAHLLERGVPPERILLLTFTRRAADDMLARSAALCGHRDAVRRAWGGTFHAVAHRLISEHAAQLGLADVSVIDPGDVADLLDLLRDDHGLTAADERTRLPRPATLADIYTRSVNTDRPAREVIVAEFPWCEPHADAIVALLRDYVARKRTRGLLDFDDLLLAWRAMLAQPVIRDRLVARWDHVLVDEYQDVNRVQVEIVRALRPDGVGLTVVGDEAQAIYGFRGATSGHLLDLAYTLPGASIVRLERNFRSHQPILDFANVVRPGDAEQTLVLAAHRSGGQRPRLVRCYDAADEARLVTDAVLAAVEDGGRLRDHAVLMRASHHSDLLEIELAARRVPFEKFGGLKFLEAAHVKDFLAVLRVTMNPADEVAWFRLLRLHRGVGTARARGLLGLLLDEASEPNIVIAAAPAPARTSLDATLRAVVTARDQRRVADRVTTCAGLLRPLVDARYPDASARLADLDRLAESARRAPDLAAFVAQVTLDPPASTADYAAPPHLDEDYLTLTTVHSAKGLEWPTVHVIHAIDGAFPSDMALSTPAGLEEEQRLFYVAATRARDHLALYTPLRLPHRRTGRDDRHSFAPASRFLISEALATLDVVEVAPPREVSPVPAGLPAVALPTFDGLFD
jgi:DNA helicase II / ATP-dependent DNA helicase PcrA